jgi:hypothetical protein
MDKSMKAVRRSGTAMPSHRPQVSLASAAEAHASLENQRQIDTVLLLP